MAELLTARNILSVVENIICNAKNYVVLISPYVRPPRVMFERLKDASKNNIRITLIYRKGELGESIRSELRRLKGLSLYSYDGLHAKCYFNEKSMVITSMNFTESSEGNRELGILLKREEDKVIFQQALKEANSILDASIRDKEASSDKEPRVLYIDGDVGFCIRCKKRVSVNFDFPYCFGCMFRSVLRSDPEYKEKYCHMCGKPTPASLAKPFCYSCYKKLNA